MDEMDEMENREQQEMIPQESVPQRKSRWPIIRKILSYLLVATLSSCVTFFVFIGPQIAPSKLDYLKALLMERYIGTADETVLEDAAAAAMVDALGDRWSYYIPASEYAAYQDQMTNSYVGIGVTVQAREDGKGIEITKVTKGGSADKAGIQAGDILTAVEGKSITGQTVSQIKELIQGEEGTKVKLELLRGEETVKVTVTRQRIQVPVATGVMLKHNIGLVTIENFDERCAEETIAAIDSLVKQGATSLIFDVRNNPGGYKRELVKVLDYLLPEGEIFRAEDYTGRVETDKSDKKCLNIPMAVLVNGNSYSAAEFFAAALMEYDWAEVIGEQTCGKSYFQNTFTLPDGSAVGLSVGKYYTPKGVSLADVGGLKPDRVVKVDEETAYAIYAGSLSPEEDPQIQAAVEYLLG